MNSYNRFRWDFMREVLIGLNFPGIFVNWIMECVQSTSYSLSINGALHGYFDGKRGLRQGDPMSPTLFTLCMEYMARMLTVKTKDAKFSFHPRCKGLKITHLAFADDLMLFCRGDANSVEIFMKALNEMEQTSGLAISPTKSKMFCAGVVDDLSFSRIPVESLPVRYLGIPLDAQRLKVVNFSPLIESVNKFFSAWKGCSLTYAGRLELLNSVIQGVVAFWIQNFQVPSTVVDHIISLCRNFLWNGKKALVAWEALCLPKEEGGLGLRNIKIWNAAILVKVIWDIHRNKNSLWIKWIHNFYLPGKEFWSWKPTRNDSALMRSITRIRDMMIQICGGKSESIIALTNCNGPGGLSSSKVYEIIRPKAPKCFAFRFIWKGFIPPKFSFTTWLCLRGRLPTKDNLHFLQIDGTCTLCGKGMENINHLFFSCDFSKQVWEEVRAELGITRCTTSIKSAIKWINRDVLGSRVHSKIGPLAILCTIYHIWLARRSSSIWRNSHPPFSMKSSGSSVIVFSICLQLR
ncbi:MAG: reverse transcriptase domain-containing protein, partial [Candidatus Phytoplasma australasiaticum]|nr:reverse transcriptase domain-containing protein [Candidatus Phytoplasma australasiaticum]